MISCSLISLIACQNILASIAAPQQNRVLDSLNKAEKDYLEKFRVLKVCTDPDWLPFERLGGGQQHEGIFSEYLRLISAHLDIAFEIVPTKSWEQSLNFFRNGQCQVMSGLNKTSERLTFMRFSDPYLSVPMVVISRQDEPFVTSLDSLQGKTLASVEGYRIAEEIKISYPDIAVTFVKSTQEALRAVSEDRLYASVGSVLGMSYNVDYLGLKNLKIIGFTQYTGAYRIAVQPELAPFIPLLNRAISALTKEQKSTIVNRWVRMMDYKKPDYTLVWQIVGSVFLLLFFISYRHLNSLKNNKKLAMLNEQLSVTLEEQETLIKMVSHQYRTPLSILKSALRLVRIELASSSPQVLHRLSIMDKATERMRDTLDISLEQSRIAQQASENEAPSITSLLSEALEDVITLHSPRFMGLFQLHGDFQVQVTMPRAELICCLDNVIANAVKYGSQSPEITIAIEQSVTWISLTIKDTGVGIPEIALNRIFDKFYRADNVSSFSGAGLGLNIVKQLMNKYGGDINVTSVINSGTQVTLLFPINPVLMDKENKYDSRAIG